MNSQIRNAKNNLNVKKLRKFEIFDFQKLLEYFMGFFQIIKYSVTI